MYKNILITSAFTPAINDFSIYSNDINSRYAKKHDYKFKFVCYPDIRSFHPSWYKMILIWQELPYYDGVFWIDSDAIFINHTKKIEDVIDQKFSFSVCRDCVNNRFNCGTMFWKNDSNSKKLIEEVLKQINSSRSDLYEQTVLNNFYNNNFLNMQKFTKIHDLYDFNSVTPWRVFHPNQYIIHMMGRSTLEKINVFKIIAENSIGNDIQIPDLVLDLNKFKKHLGL